MAKKLKKPMGVNPIPPKPNPHRRKMLDNSEFFEETKKKKAEPQKKIMEKKNKNKKIPPFIPKGDPIELDLPIWETNDDLEIVVENTFVDKIKKFQADQL